MPKNLSDPFVNVQTHFTRGTLAAQWIRNRHRTNPKDPWNILLVGIGSDDFFVCGYEAYNIFASLEAAGIDYTATIVDVLPELVEDFKERKVIHIAPYDDGERRAWNSYLANTKQKARVLDGHERFLLLEESRSENAAEDLLDKPILEARIPASLERKLASGEVQVITGSISTVPLADHGPFDYASCMNVLYHVGYSFCDKFPTVRNIADNLREGSILQLNKLCGYWRKENVEHLAAIGLNHVASAGRCSFGWFEKTASGIYRAPRVLVGAADGE